MIVVVVVTDRAETIEVWAGFRERFYRYMTRRADASTTGRWWPGSTLQRKLGVPAVLALPMPMYVPTRQFPWPGQQFRRGCLHR